MAWDVDRVDRLKDLWCVKGYSASQIARILGKEGFLGVTRNAVIGKAHRMGLSQPGQPQRGAGRNAAKTPSMSVRGGGRKSLRGGASASSTHAKAKQRLPQLQPAEKDIRILDLDDYKCRWPMGDPQDESFRFCGAPKLQAAGEGSSPDSPSQESYCEYHTHVAYQRSSRALAAQEVLPDDASDAQPESGRKISKIKMSS